MNMENMTFEEESKAILKGLEKTYEKMVKFKKRKENTSCCFGHGKDKLIPSKEIQPRTVNLT